MTPNIPDLSQLTHPVARPRVGDQLAAWVHTACIGVDVSWEVGLNLLPTQQGPVPGFLVLLCMPSPVLGHTLTHVLLVDLGSLTEPVVTRNVREALEQLRKQRAALLAAPTNGVGA
jgi:hypothetical protein